MLTIPFSSFSTRSLLLGISAVLFAGEAFDARADILTYYFSTAIVDSSVVEYDAQSLDGSFTFDTDSVVGDTASIISFEFGIPSATAFWTGTGGEVRTYSFGGPRLGVQLTADSGAVYTQHPTDFLPTDFAYLGDLSIPSDNLVGPFPVQFSTTTQFTTHIVFQAGSNWIESQGSVTLTDQVPEPSSAAALGLGALALLRRKKQQAQA